MTVSYPFIISQKANVLILLNQIVKSYLMNGINPYNCTKPGNLFVGYERLRKHLLNGFRNGNSFAIIGGRRCGKTSLLFQIKKDLKDHGLSPFNPISLYCDMQELGKVTPNLIFEKIYYLLTSEIDAKPWQDGEPNKEYINFLNQLDATKPRLDEKYGTDWLAVLLIDELDNAVEFLPGDQFFQNLRNFLMVSRFSTYFRVVATGVKGLVNLIQSGGSPLNNLRNKYLRVLSKKEVHDLIFKGFSGRLGSETEMFICQITGGHPCLLQGILEKIWENCEETEVDNQEIKQAIKEFLREHHDFDRWLRSFGLPEHIVYQRLIRTENQTASFNQLQQELDPSISTRIDEAVTCLSYHGIIDDSDLDEIRLVNKIFKDWYQKNCPIPNIEEVLDTFERLKVEVDALTIDDQTKKQIQQILDEGIAEIRKPETEGQPKKTKLKSVFQKIGTYFKAAGATADTIKKITESAEKIAPYIGLAAHWFL